MIKRLTFENCFCFRGKHEIFLQPKVYSISAKYEGVEGRSNWAGKTSIMKLLGPMPFFGWHNDSEDGWLTEGEDYGFYEIETTSGHVIRRERTRGKSTQVKLVFPDGRIVGQKGAQDSIVEWLGLSELYYFAGFYFRQKDIDKLITIRPGDRQDLVMNWLDLGVLQKWEDDARQQLSEAVETVAKRETEIKTIESAKTMLRSVSVEEVETMISKLRQEMKEASDSAIRENELVTRVANIQMNNAAIYAAKQSLALIVAKGKELKAEIDSVVIPNADELRTCLDTASDKAEDLTTECHKLMVLAKGEFDGECPVSKGFQCPAKALINADRAKHAEALKTARASQLEAQAEVSDLSQKVKIVEAAKRGLDRKRFELDALRKEWATVEALAKKVPEPEPEFDPEAAAKFNREVGIIQAKIWDLEKTKQQIIDLNSKYDYLKNQLDVALASRARLSEAAKIFKIAQNRCARDGLAEIENGANALLKASNIDLTVTAKWDREGRDPAKQCFECGEPFPASRKIKECARCGEPRGLNVIDKLVIKLSNRSGGAEDLGGLALQLSAASWLRVKKGSCFNTVYLDEPISALDDYNRKALGGQIARMLSGRFGFSQAFLVTHDQSFDELFPGQIQILVKKNGDRIVTAV